MSQDLVVHHQGHTLHCRIEGRTEADAPWVTLSHSLACDLSMFDAQAALLAPHYRVLRFDTRGHGRSSVPVGPYTLDALAEDLHAIFGAVGIKRTHFVGLSMGGMVGQTYALRHPGCLASLVLADTTARRPRDAATMWGERIRIAREQGMDALVDSTLARWFTAPFRAARPEVMARIAEAIRRTPVAGYAGCCAAIAQVDLLDRLAEISCPTLVLVGDQDHGTPPEMARQIHAHLPGSQLVFIESASHLSNIEQPEAFNRALAGFLLPPR